MIKIKQVLQRIPLLIWFILLLVIIFSTRSSQYLTYRNLLILLQQGAVLLIVASAATFVIISGGLDLSLGAILTLGGIAAALAVTAGLPVLLVFLIGALTGAVCGGVNGFFISYCNLPPFITTLGTQGIFYGLALVLTNKEGIVIYDEAFLKIGATLDRKIPMAFICCLLLYIIMIFIQDRTRFGRYLYAIGGNAEGARLSGVHTRFWKFMIYAFAGLITGLAAVILTSRLEVADPIVGKKWEFEAICCAILGGTSMNIGKGDVKGTILGVALLTIIRSGMNVIRIPSIWQPAILGTILILSIVFEVRASMKEEK